ncbi:hypothetical protein LNKW23_39270 [Paralimibaculum aggregatum]|uniref:Peptidoglycan binding-like domain-containing protein n=1 Tax=Paralimibaculum aggregatum TaxID=3036245 RepID=A0ABQ6LS79_9RHOB|nr:peptidoglycan-binding protein [Limibaculum sp. NKW23]GMG84711.1 hypothetical protein LNKW23_39270 [Limibaculum sp. NKW23]
MSILKIGSKGQPVLNLQKALIDLKIRPRPKATGTFDTVTEDAVRAFQKTHRMKRDGKVGTKTAARIRAAVEQARRPIQMSVPDYAPIMKHTEQSYEKVRKDWMKTLAMVKRHDNPVLNLLGDEYRYYFTLFEKQHGDWRKFAKKVGIEQAGYDKTIDTDPWSAREHVKRCRDFHRKASAANNARDGAAEFKKMADPKVKGMLAELAR